MVAQIPLLTEQQIQDRVIELATKLNSDYDGKNLLVVGILKGAFMFFSDMVRRLTVPMAVDFMIVSSYTDTETTGKINVHYDLRESITGKDVLIVEDIVDTGITLNAIRQMLLQRAPASLKICALLDKKERRLVNVPVDYVGFDIPNEFVIGYGIDYNNNYRNLPYITVYKKEG
ncbi:MAG: hypoxanthine phosphoribosyltransferase [Candidatus Magnetoovum sp. WYHC-5]|nr:hypoxanthine phosphoribosyltransferase [Candidatus Magnetoovum sp. WYHC-5]